MPATHHTSLSPRISRSGHCCDPLDTTSSTAPSLRGRCCGSGHQLSRQRLGQCDPRRPAPLRADKGAPSGPPFGYRSSYLHAGRYKISCAMTAKILEVAKASGLAVGKDEGASLLALSICRSFRRFVLNDSFDQFEDDGVKSNWHGRHNKSGIQPSNPNCNRRVYTKCCGPVEFLE